MRCASVGMWGIRHDKAAGSTTVPDLVPLNNARVSRNDLKANVRSPEAKLNRSCPRSPSQNASNTEITIRVASAPRPEDKEIQGAVIAAQGTVLRPSIRSNREFHSCSRFTWLMGSFEFIWRHRTKTVSEGGIKFCSFDIAIETLLRRAWAAGVSTLSPRYTIGEVVGLIIKMTPTISLNVCVAQPKLSFCSSSLR